MNVSPWDTTGPSMLGTQFYTPGWSPPKPRAPKPLTTQKRDIDIDALKAYRATGATLRECARRFGIGKDAIRSRLGEPSGTRIRKITFDQRKALAMHLDGLSLRTIGAALNTNRHAIGRYIDALDLSDETKHEVALKAGARVRALQEAARPKRVVVDVDGLVSMRLSGATIEQCAKHFNVGFYVARNYLKGIGMPFKPKAKRSEPVGESYHLVVTAAQRAAIAKNGGAVWVRSLIDGAAA